MSRWQAIVFDLDDTLYPERDYVMSGFQAAALWAQSHLGVEAEEGYADLKHLYEQGIRGDTFNRWLSSRGMSGQELVDALVRVYREHEPHLTPFAEVAGVLTALHETFRLGLVSDGYLDVQQRKWASLGLAEYFDAVVFSDTLGRAAWKPSPLPFAAVLRQLNVDDPSGAVYVADNPVKDFRGAREFGMFTVWTRRPGGEYASCTPLSADHAPDAMIGSLDELLALLL